MCILCNKKAFYGSNKFEKNEIFHFYFKFSVMNGNPDIG